MVPPITVLSYDLRSPPGHAISSPYKGQKEKERVLCTPGDSGDFATHLGVSLARCMLGKAHAGQIAGASSMASELSHPLPSHDADTENGEDINGV